VRELRTALEHGVVMCNTARVGVKHLPAYIVGGGTALFPGKLDSKNGGGSPSFEANGDLNLEKMESAMINAALQRTGDNRTEAAELLGLSRRTLQRKLREMGRVKRVRRAPKPEA